MHEKEVCLSTRSDKAIKKEKSLSKHKSDKTNMHIESVYLSTRPDKVNNA